MLHNLWVKPYSITCRTARTDRRRLIEIYLIHLLCCKLQALLLTLTHPQHK